MKVLVVDDEPDMQFLFEQRFRKEIRNHKVEFEFALSGEQALCYLENHLKEDVFILSDINMPGMTGFELLQKIRQGYNNQPLTIMIITAYGDRENYNRAIQLGADDFLTKPIDFSLLKTKLNIPAA